MTAKAATVVTSLTNERIKAIRALEMRKVRKETGLFVAEGTSLIINAKDHGIAPETLVYQSGSLINERARAIADWATARGARTLEISPQVLGKLASKDNPQTMLGVFRQTFAAMPAVAALAATDTWLALEEVRDPGNLGTIIRTADAAGASGIILIGTCCDPYSPEAVRATMGSIFSVPIVRLDREAFRAMTSRWSGSIIATTITAAVDFRTAQYRGPEMILMGSEGPGLTADAEAAASVRVKIPMAGSLDSLNLAVATALMLYQVRASRLKV